MHRAHRLHEHKPPVARQLLGACKFRGGDRRRLFTKHVQAGPQGVIRPYGMDRVREGYIDGLNAGMQKGPVIGIYPGDPVPPGILVPSFLGA